MSTLSKNHLMIDATVGVWILAAASAALLAFALNRPLRLPGVALFEQPLAGAVTEPSGVVMESVSDDMAGTIGAIWVYGTPEEGALPTTAPPHEGN